jgi:hypothetical protein
MKRDDIFPLGLPRTGPSVISVLGHNITVSVPEWKQCVHCQSRVHETRFCKLTASQRVAEPKSLPAAALPQSNPGPAPTGVRPSVIVKRRQEVPVTSVAGMTPETFSWLQVQLKRRGKAAENIAVFGPTLMHLDSDTDIIQCFEGEFGKSSDTVTIAREYIRRKWGALRAGKPAPSAAAPLSPPPVLAVAVKGEGAGAALGAATAAVAPIASVMSVASAADVSVASLAGSPCEPASRAAASSASASVLTAAVKDEKPSVHSACLERDAASVAAPCAAAVTVAPIALAPPLASDMAGCACGFSCMRWG